jgi:hypothetical protein
MHHFCTLFDSNYLVRGLTLYDSLREHCGPFQLHILCLNDACYEFFQQHSLPGIVPVALATFENSSPALAEARGNRTLIEYYFTCSSAFTHFVMQQNPDIELVTYLDADMYFFADPAPIFAELEGHSIGISPHRFPGKLRKLERYGLYNVAWVSFRRDPDGLSCLQHWNDQCLEWCYDRLEGERFADQKYLDAWPDLYQGVRVIEHPGANLAPWNVGRHRIQESDGRVLVDDQPLIFYHYHGLKRVGSLPVYDTSLGYNRAVLTRTLREKVYRPYLQALVDARRHWLEEDDDGAELSGIRNFVNELWRSQLSRSLSKLAINLYSLLVCRAFMRFTPAPPTAGSQSGNR